MVAANLLLGLVVVAVLVDIASPALPHGWKPCRWNSKDLTVCLTKEIEKAIRSLKNGDKKMGVLSLDPLLVKKVVLDQGTFKLTFTDIFTDGLSNLKIKELSLNKRGDVIEFDSTSTLEKMINRGHYKVDGKLLSLPVSGEGQFVITWTGLTTKAKHSFKTVKKDGKEYFVTDHLHLELSPKKMHYDFKNLFNGNKELSDRVLTAFNDNWEQILQEVRPSLTKTMEVSLTNIADQVFRKLPKSEYVLN